MDNIKTLPNRRIENNSTEYAWLSRIEKILFVIFAMQSMGAPGSFSGVLPGSIASLWFNINSVATFALVGICLLKILQRQRIYKTNLFFLIFCLYVLLTGLVASGFSSAVLQQSQQLICTVIIAVYIGRNFKKEQIVDLLAYSQIIVSLMILYMIAIGYSGAYVTDGYYDFNLVGLYTTKNSCGYEIIFGTLLFYYKFRKSESKPEKIFWLALTVGETILAIYSRTVGCFVAGILAILLYEIITRKKKSVNLAKLYVIINAAFWVFVCFVLPSAEFLLGALGRNITLTGRTVIWNAILSFMDGNHMFFGYGYGGFWGNSENTRDLYSLYTGFGNSEGIVGGHNLFMELYVNIGIIGLILFLAMVLIVLNKTKRYECKAFDFEILMLSFLAIRGLMERTLNSFTYDTLLLFLILGMILNSCLFLKRIK